LVVEISRAHFPKSTQLGTQFATGRRVGNVDASSINILGFREPETVDSLPFHPDAALILLILDAHVTRLNSFVTAKACQAVDRRVVS
jgi:hypothetical protein